VESLDIPYMTQDFWNTHKEAKLICLWVSYSLISLLPMSAFLLCDRVDDHFIAYGRGTASKYSIFQYSKQESERKYEHRVGQRMLREEERIGLIEKKRCGRLTPNEELRLKLILEKAKSD
jgi:hypothetical protein